MSDDNEPVDAASDKPRFLSGLNGLIAGITSAVIAISALLAAVTNLFGNHPAEPARVAATETTAADTAATPESTATPDKEDPAHYVGTNSDGQPIEVNWDGKHWIYTDPETSYVYVDLTSADETMVLAYDREIDSYLRWPTDGGAIEESFKNELEFKPIGNLKPSGTS